ncbi:MAG: DUF2304 domain-containing protein [Actinomycetota bacterium]|nr:DUF2304 domain-containing protein [Actinomycetota bacterium]MDQ2957986.1 DUF2304 domain-containing protein [Actinomycetota bacterium]
MNLIKILLIVSFLSLMTWAFRNRNRVGLRASLRLALLLLTAIAIASIIDPGLTQSVANVVGVTRGTDLILYLLVVIFTLTAIGTYFRFREQERRLIRVVRDSAIRDAILTQGIPGATTTDEHAP